MNSVNTNFGALIALQNLNKTNSELGQVQDRINTGLKVSSARDNGAIFAIAEGQRARVGALSSVRDGIDRAGIVIDTALSAGSSIGTVLQQMRAKAIDAQQSDLSSAQRATIQKDFDALRSQIDQIANAATFNGANLINGSNAGLQSQYKVLTSDIGGASSSASGVYTVTGQALSSTTITSANQVFDQLAGFDAGDGVVFSFGGNTSASTDDASVTVSINAGETVGQFVARVGEATNNRVTASFDAETGRISFASSQFFRTDTTSGIDSATNAAFLGDNRSSVSGSGGFQVKTNQAIRADYTLAPAAFAVSSNFAAPTGSSNIVRSSVATADTDYAAERGFQENDVITFRDGGGNVLGSVTLGNQTYDQFAAAVNIATNGSVNATFANGALSYSSAGDFSVEYTNGSPDPFAANRTAINAALNGGGAPTFTAAFGAAGTTDGSAANSAFAFLSNAGLAVGDKVVIRGASDSATVELNATDSLDQFATKMQAALVTANGVGTTFVFTDDTGFTLGGTALSGTTIELQNYNPSTASQELFTGTATGATSVQDARDVKLDGEAASLVNTANGLAAGDTVQFFDTAGNAIGSAVTIGASDTVRTLIDSVRTATNGRVSAQLNDDNTISYTGADAFDVRYTEAGTDVAGSLNPSQGSVLAGSTGQTFRLEGTAFSGVTYATNPLDTDLAGIGGLTATDTVTIRDANGTQLGSAITINASGTAAADTTQAETIGDFITAVSAQSGGKVTASFDTANNKFVFTSTEGFRLSFTDGGVADPNLGAELVGNGSTGSRGVAGVASASSFVSPTTSGGASNAPSVVTVQGFDFRTTNGGALSSLAQLDVQTGAANAVAAIDLAMTTLNDGLARLGAQGRALDIQKDFLQKLSDNVEKGIGALVDADLAKESARLQSLQIKQQLGAQALSIANQQPSILLSFFR